MGDRVILHCDLNCFFASVELLLYNGQRGRKSKWYQWGYYLIYPIHFMVLYVIELLIR